MNDYLHNLIQSLAIAHVAIAVVAAFVAFMAITEGVSIDKRFLRPTVALIALIPVTTAWLATYGGAR